MAQSKIIESVLQSLALRKACETLKALLRRSLLKAGYMVYKISAAEQQVLEAHEKSLASSNLENIFGSAMPRLQQLKERYAKVQHPVAQHSVWAAGGGTEAQPQIGWGGLDLREFRGHGAYLWSYSSPDPLLARLKYFIYADAVRQQDAAGLLSTLKEDGAFGCITFDYPGIGSVSRDLMDSVIELNFMHQHLDILARPDLRVLDIGAGYGRMAHRMLEANAAIKGYTCVDAVPESTFLCEFYLEYRDLGKRARVIPLDALDEQLFSASYDLALNIHSFSECTFAAIQWWLNALLRLGVRHLLIVPNNSTEFLSMEADGSHRDYAPVLKTLGYRLIASQAVFADPAVEELVGARDVMFLFELLPEQG